MHGLAVHGECCPHHLLLDESRYLGERPGDFVMSPPLRTAEHRAALWAALVDGTLEVVAADHAAWPAPAQGARPGLPRGGARRRGQRPAAAAAGGAGRAGRGLRLGARRAPDGREPRAHLPPAGQGRDRARARMPTSSLLQPGDVRPVPPVPPYWRVDNGIFRDLPHVPPRVVLQRGRVIARGRGVRRRARGGAVRPRRHVTTTGACETT